MPAKRASQPKGPRKVAAKCKLAQRVQRARAIDWRPAYLAALTETGVYSWAYTAAGIGCSTPWRERQKSPEFAAAEAEAVKIASRLFEGEAVRRAIHGLRKYRFTAQGEPVLDPRTGEQYCELEYSDTLLVKLLSSHIPEVYRDKLDATMGGNVHHVHLTLEEAKKRLADARS